MENVENAAFYIQEERAKIMLIKIELVGLFYSRPVALLKYHILLILLLDKILF